MPKYTEPVAELRCPTCGQVLPLVKEARVDLNEGTLLINSHSIHLQPKQAEVLFALLRNMPNFMSRDRLIQQVWGFEGPDDADNNLSVHFARLRKMLKPFGYTISVIAGGDVRLIYRAKEGPT